MLTPSLAELLDLSMADVVMHFVAFGLPFLFVLDFIIILVMFLMISFGCFDFMLVVLLVF